MPRKRKPATQAVQVPKGLPYGQGEAAAAQQRAIPLPGPGSTPQPQRGTPASAGVSSAPPADAVNPMALAIQAAQAMPAPQGGLLAPSRRPGEPVTAGLSTGPGPGPEALPLQAFGAEDDVLMDLINAYRIAPSPALARLIELARGRATASQRQRDAGRVVRRPRY